MKKGFVFYASFYEGINELPDENQLHVYQAVVKFAITGEQPTNLTGIEKAVFALIRPQIEANNQRYENGCKGGAPKGNSNAKKTTKNNQKQPTVDFKDNQKQPKEKEKDKYKYKEKDIKKKEINNKEKRTPEQETVPDTPQQQEFLPEPITNPKPKQNTPKTPQAEVFEYFAEKYKNHTGIKYLSKKEEFVILAKLIAEYDITRVKQKIDWLEVGCTHPGVFWFAKDINDFNIKTLQTQWNLILPKLTDKQRKQQEKQKEEAERKAKVMAELAKQGIKIAETAQNSTEVGHVRV